ncbi:MULTISPECIES: hypothetical protein [Fictibacillus]|uniref:Uncharacterized protein n=1 Tax=Fictibacillus norfolkensis TaxID=2762233 RepID=A0ABR8SS99_9BACL|nr:hypothetical protein [Fictibacillus norfolkensis]MBD7966376.1 hypothetical protein [Fictibacillus norfolkensis]
MFHNSRLSAQEVKDIYNTNKYGTTNIAGYGEAIIKITSYSLNYSQNTGTIGFIIYTPSGDITATVPIQDVVGWTPYTGPIPPQFGHQGGLPGGMGGQGYGQGQSFPSGGGQGTPGGWGTWGY